MNLFFHTIFQVIEIVDVILQSAKSAFWIMLFVW